MAYATQANSKYLVYLRIKPQDLGNIDDSLDKAHFSTTQNVFTTSHLNKKNETVLNNYTFNQVFMPSTIQEEIFNEVVYPRLEAFFSGEESLLFSYGTSNSGKSFTMQGTSTNPGIIPRALFSIFKTIEDHRDDECPLIPFKSTQACVLSDEERKLLDGDKRRLIECLPKRREQDIDESISNALEEDMGILIDHTPFVVRKLAESIVISVWISFNEIYNEQVFDLLDDGSNLSKHLQVRSDEEDGAYYVEGSKLHRADNWQEAFNLYRYGRRNLHISETLLNRKSSRSHCIFTIKLLTRSKDSPDSFISVDAFTICDLAGTERSEHASGNVVREKEAAKINSSLLALSRCFLILKTGWCKNNVLLPCRGSKLTMLLKKFLVGKGKLLMLANISQEANLIFQTNHVLEMTSIAHNIQVKQKVKSTKSAYKMRFSTKYRLEMGQDTPNVREHKRQETKIASMMEEIEELKKANELLTTNAEVASKRAADFEALYEAELHRSAFRDAGEASSFAEISKLRHDLMLKTREFNKAQMDWHACHFTQNQKMENLIAILAKHFSFKPFTTDIERIVRKVCFLHNDMKRMAAEEIEEKTEMLSTLEALVHEKDVQIEKLKGQVVELQERLNFYEQYCANIEVKNAASSGEVASQDLGTVEPPLPKARRQLLQRDNVDLNQDLRSSANGISLQEPQPSPNSIMKVIS